MAPTGSNTRFRGRVSVLGGMEPAIKPTVGSSYILLSGAVPGPTGAALLFSWLGWGRLGVTAGPPFPFPDVIASR